jgi:hypothetical protein
MKVTIQTIQLLKCYYNEVRRFDFVKESWVKGIVQQDLTGIETRLKQSVLMN